MSKGNALYYAVHLLVLDEEETSGSNRVDRGTYTQDGGNQVGRVDTQLLVEDMMMDRGTILLKE